MSSGLTKLALGVVLFGLFLVVSIDAAPLQELEPKEGYVPVYIREGDTPLKDINPKLAEAFDESKQSDDISKPTEGIQSEPEVAAEIQPSRAESSPYQLEAAKQAIDELVKVIENEMLDKLGFGITEKSQNNEKSTKNDSEVEVAPEEPPKDEEGSSEKATDVLSVEDFKAKEKNMKSIDKNSDTVSSY